MFNIGQKATLTIIKDLDFGIILANEEEDEILLPRKQILTSYEIGDEMEVFIYKDQENRPIANMKEPLIKLNDFAVLRVEQLSEFGAFLDWGMPKHLLVPFSEQPEPMEVGENHLVYMYLDEQSDRLVASARIGRFLENDHLRIAEGDEVEVMLWQETELGVNVLVNRIHKGLIYHNYFHTTFAVGRELTGYVQKIREGNKLDISLQRFGHEHLDDVALQILGKLETEAGFLPFSDKSSPESIKKAFGMSKKMFKKAIGKLYKARKITIETDGLHLKRGKSS